MGLAAHSRGFASTLTARLCAIGPSGREIWQAQLH